MSICIGRPGVLGPVLGRLGPILYRASANVRLIHGAGGDVWLLHGAGGDVRHVHVACGDVRLIHMAGGDVGDRKSNLNQWCNCDQQTTKSLCLWNPYAFSFYCLCLFFLFLLFLIVFSIVFSIVGTAGWDILLSLPRHELSEKFIH